MRQKFSIDSIQIKDPIETVISAEVYWGKYKNRAETSVIDIAGSNIFS